MATARGKALKEAVKRQKEMEARIEKLRKELEEEAKKQ